MNPLIIVAIIIGVLLVILGVLYFFGKKAEKKTNAQREAMEAQSQTMSFYIIDKKKCKLSEAGFPKVVVEQTPKLLRRTKVPVIKVKVGPRVMSLICDDKVFQTLLPMQEVRATVSGMYVMSATRLRGPVYEGPKSKKALRAEKKAAQFAEEEAKKRAEERLAKKNARKERKAEKNAAREEASSFDTTKETAQATSKQQPQQPQKKVGGSRQSQKKKKNKR